MQKDPSTTSTTSTTSTGSGQAGSLHRQGYGGQAGQAGSLHRQGYGGQAGQAGQASSDEGEGVTTVWQGRFIDAVVKDGWEYVRRKGVSGVVGIIPLTDDGEVILVEQYRPPVNAIVVEFPAGLAGDTEGAEDESFEKAAARELLEETGYEASRMELAFSGVTSAGVTDEIVTFYLATGLEKKGFGGGDDAEDITVHKVKIDNLVPWLKDCESKGMLVDLKVYSALYLWHNLNDQS